MTQPLLGPLPAGQPRDAMVGEVGRVLVTVPRHGQVVVALSGGADSTALANLSVAARPDVAVTLVHVRHGLRDDRADVAAVAATAARLDRPYHLVEVEVRGAGRGPEAAARDARYAALRQAAADAGATAILVGHTADDQAETLLLRLARGSGVAGLAGMRPVAGDVIRPLLYLRRGDVRALVAASGWPYAEDPTNRDAASRRVRARREVLPALDRLHPDSVGALGRLAELAAADSAALEQWADSALERLAAPDGASTASVTVADLEALPAAVARRVVRNLLRRLGDGGYPPTAAEVARVLALCDGDAVDLGGARASRRDGRITLVR